MSEQNETLEMNASDKVDAKDNFGQQAERQLKGTAGTLHLTREENKDSIFDTAWMLSSKTKQPVIIVVRAN